MQLAKAGFRGAGAEYAFLTFRLVAPIVFFLVPSIYVFLILKWNQPFMFKVGVAIAAAISASRRPRYSSATRPSSEEGARARLSQHGRSADHLRRIGHVDRACGSQSQQEIGAESIAMAEEMTLLAAEMSYLAERRIAFENLGLRTGLESIRALTTVLVQSEQYGTPLGAALRVLARKVATSG